jgi:hypothetical protein
MSPAILALLVTAGALPEGEVPAWDRAELVSLFQRAEQISTIPSPADRDNELGRVISAAYRLPPNVGESLDTYSRRLTKHREPGHPEIKTGQWLLAAARLFYGDTGQRADTLSRLEVEPRARAYLEQKAREAKGAAATIGSQLVVAVQTGQGFVAPLPVAEGLPPEVSTFGCEIIVRAGKIEVNGLERVSFVDDRPPPDAPRTGQGSLRELASSQKEWNLRANMMGMIDPAMKKGQKLARVWAPGAGPAVYVNEILRAAREAQMRTVFLMVSDKATGKLRELPLHVTAPAAKKTKKGQKPPLPQPARCRDEELLQRCVERLVEASAQGPLVIPGS